MAGDRPDDAARVAEVVARLMRMRSNLGARAFRSAVDRALHAIGAAAHQEAERRAARVAPSRPKPKGSNVISFPARTPPEETS